MRNRSIDITCKARENVLELHAKLKDIEFSYYLALYEAVNTNISLGWVPIPMPDEVIKQELEANFGTVLKITDRKHSDGRSGMRIVTIKNLIFKVILFQVTFKLVVAKYMLPIKAR